MIDKSQLSNLIIATGHDELIKQNNVKIKLTDFGIAYAYEDTIELNKVLFKHPKLLKQVLGHELEHIQKPSYLDTLKIDLRATFDFKKQRLLSRCLRKNKLASWQSALPVWYQDKQICFNACIITFYLVYVAAGVMFALMLMKMLGTR